MTCARCQTINPEGSPTCASCGAPLGGLPPGYAPPPGQAPQGYPPGYAPPGYGFTAPMQTRTSGMAIAGFILAFLCPLLGLIFSIIGNNEVKRSGGAVTGGGLAVAGIIISICMFLVNIMYVASK
jgi:hypothetical protein